MKRWERVVHGRSTGLAALGVGALLALMVGWWRLGVGYGETLSPTVHLWLCDRGAQALIGLNRDGFEVERRAVEFPLEVAPLPGGGLWVLSAKALGPASDRCLRRMDARGAILVERDFRRARGLSRGPDNSARLRVGEDGAAITVEVRSTASRGGELMEVSGSDPSSGVNRKAPPHDASVSRDESSFAMFSFEDRFEWVARDRQDAVLWRRDWPRTGNHAAVAPRLHALGEGSAWVVETRGVLTHFDIHGVHSIQGLGASPVVASALDDRRQLWLLTPGACHKFDHTGTPLPGQGGFDHLVAMALVPRVPQANSPTSE